jgi:hypothetical protein
MKQRPGSADDDGFESSLGPQVERSGSGWITDLSELPIYHGLSVLSHALSEMVIAQARSDRVDINVERAVRVRENRELRNDLGVALVKICADQEVGAEIARHPDLFEVHLRSLLGTLQWGRYRRALFPDADTGPSETLVFHFDFPSAARTRRFRFVLEFIRSNREEAEGHLRVTIEDPAGRHLDLSSIRHREVTGLERRRFIAGSTRIAHTWRERLFRAASAGRRMVTEERSPHSHVFAQLDGAGIDGLDRIELAWDEEFVSTLLDEAPAVAEDLLKKALLALEDLQLRAILSKGESLRIDIDEHSIHLDLAELGRVLHVGLGQPRDRSSVDDFLERMPSLRGLTRGETGKPLEGIAVFLIHHITADVLGLISSIRSLGCRDLVTLFVDYSGDAPGSFLGPLLDLPSDEFTALSLIQIPDDRNIEGSYQLSTRYSDVRARHRYDDALSQPGLRFFDAMSRVARILFLEQVERANAAGRRCLLIEDGGYLAPALNRARLADYSVKRFLEQDGASSNDPRQLSEVLDPCLIGSVEHTRNGYDRLAEVQAEHGRLAWPAFSIAISRLKREDEAGEVAVSILSALESVLHAEGLVLGRRRGVVLGSNGAIGRRLVSALERRLDGGPGSVAGVDVDVDVAADEPTHGETAQVEASTWCALPEATRREVDLILGVTGTSILSGDDFEEWLLHSSRPTLHLASGSTKTEEFSELTAWLQALLAQSEPRIGDIPVQLRVSELRDPITDRFFGHRYRFELERSDGPVRRDIILLARGTPLNFLYYGVATELIDEVIAQLLECSLGLVERAAVAQREQDALSASLHAIDHEIDARGRPLRL